MESRLSRPLAVINDEMSRRYWPDGQDPIGSRIHVPALQFNNNVVMTPPGTDSWLEVIGVVGSALNEGLREPPSPAVYLPYKLALTPHCDFLLKTDFDPHLLIRAIKERIHEIEPNLSPGDPLTLEEQLGDYDRALPRFLTALFSLFGSVALALAASGLYSVIAYGVERRTREMGIRIALGATKADVLALVTRSTARYAAAGLTAGLLVSILALRAVAQVVPDWKATDPVALILVTLVFVPVAGLACLLPAHQATRIEPVSALRHE